MRGLNRIMGKEGHLREAIDFRKAFKEGKRFLSPHFALYIRKNAVLQARIGISISKRHFKLATRRNRLRRVAKELFREKVTPRFEGYDFVVASRAKVLKANNNEAANELKQLISRRVG